MSRSARLFRFILVIIPLLIFSIRGTSQEAARLRSTLSAGGSSGVFYANNHAYFIQQSTGQQSVTGISQRPDYLLRQGFIQPYIAKSYRIPPETLPVTIYPNPFDDHIMISPDETIRGRIYITIYNLDGRIVFFSKYDDAGARELNLSSLPPSVYVLRINTATSFYHSRIIKF